MALQWPSIPNTFAPNTPARSNEVNSNFTALKNAQSNFTTISSADYTILDSDGFRVVYVSTGDADRIITLPTAADNEGRIITVKKIDAGTGGVAVTPESPALIDGAGFAFPFYNRNDFVTVQSNGTNWFILGSNNAAFTENANQVFMARMFSRGVSFSATTTADLTVSAYGMNADYCTPVAIYENSGVKANEDFSIERPTTTTLRFRVGITSSSTYIALIVGEGIG